MSAINYRQMFYEQMVLIHSLTTSGTHPRYVVKAIEKLSNTTLLAYEMGQLPKLNVEAGFTDVEALLDKYAVKPAVASVAAKLEKVI